MRIVVLDGFTANPGDLTWDEIKALGDVAVYDRTDEKDIVSRAKDADAVLLNKCPMTKDTMINLPRLKYIGVLATGYNVVDTAFAKESGIVVTNIPAYSTASVAQHVFALILEIAHHVGAHSEKCLSGAWENAKDFCFWDYPLTELDGKTIGVIGNGAIGKRVAGIAAAFGMNVITYSPSQNSEETLEKIYRESDIISLNCPLKDNNKEMIAGASISKMKKGVWIVNTARGGLVNEKDVKDALISGKIGCFAADVVSVEPIRADNPLLSAPNVILTPHIAWAPIEARSRLMKIACENLKSFINGNPINRVNV
ncbi:MAG: D-2-hydroxyacid dehydrogenase [Clostridia bacterium]|nr:D-2-hydroxyacid dehydrogenase [Clostridiales bacterium]MBQ3232556.1 D-2-hydroxyacid dehydrogenase [Clostridia bacterium]